MSAVGWIVLLGFGAFAVSAWTSCCYLARQLSKHEHYWRAVDAEQEALRDLLLSMGRHHPSTEVSTNGQKQSTP